MRASALKARVSQVGEFALIRLISRWVGTRARSVKTGIGDDAAVLATDRRHDLLFAADMLIEGRHFRLGDATPFQIGRKALAVNVSDIAAMGGVPTHALVSLGLPARLPVRFVKELYRGLGAVARAFEVCVVGGDTNRAETLIVSVAMLGRVEHGRAVLRSGARPGDVIFVSGRLGGSYASRRHLLFTPRVKEARYLASHYRLSAMIDVSDGVASDIRRIGEQSGVGAELWERNIPLGRGVSSASRALFEGEDFELLFTLPPLEAARLENAGRVKGLARFRRIGTAHAPRKGFLLRRKDGTTTPLLKGGFDHFGRNKVSR